MERYSFDRDHSNLPDVSDEFDSLSEVGMKTLTTDVFISAESSPPLTELIDSPVVLLQRINELVDFYQQRC